MDLQILGQLLALIALIGLSAYGFYKNNKIEKNADRLTNSK
jgi:hypothetical protein